jgi:hypothetical protein
VEHFMVKEEVKKGLWGVEFALIEAPGASISLIDR